MSNPETRDKDRSGNDLIARINELTPLARMNEEPSGIGWRSLLLAAKLEILRLRSALNPFADQADIIDQSGDHAADVQWFRFRGSVTAITVGDCRKAAAILAGCICRNCEDTGAVDSGGFTPWGEPIDLPCPYCQGKETP